MTKPDGRKAHILVVEDEQSMAEGLRLNLTDEGYVVGVAADGREALRLFSEGDFDLIILDVMLPYLGGFEVAERIRASAPRLPILLLTALSGHESLVHGLSLGADDYLSKPFHIDELLLRVDGMLRRASWYRGWERNATYTFGSNCVSFRDMSATNGRETFILTEREAAVLRYFIESRGRVISRAELLREVWNVDPRIETRTVDSFVGRLRRRFEPEPGKPVYFISHRGRGYRFCAADLRADGELPGRER